MRLEEVVGELLSKQGHTLATAESCTGGLVGHRITDVAGSSTYYLGGVVSYAEEVKESVLGVRHITLYTYGAVSAETACQMAQGVRRLLRASIGLAVTGIAGPGGDTPTKPVGLVYIGLVAGDGEWVEKHVWSGDRWSNKAQSAEAALDMLRRYLTGETLEGRAMTHYGEPTTVEVRFDTDGAILPLTFTWEGSVVQIEARGRHWVADSAHHWIVVTTGGRLFELRLDAQTLRWSVHRTAEPQIQPAE